MKGPIWLEVDQMVENRVGITRFAVRREPHDLVLTRIHLKTRIIGERGVEQSKGVRKMDFLQHLDTVIPTDADRSGGPLADAVHCQDQRFVEGGRIKSTRRMTLVMLCEKQLALPVEISRPGYKLLPEQIFLK